ncbi:Ribonuclease Z [Pseudomonas marincola]|uniref:Uncharacterized protein n=1 Tax=Pseudomonas marincola TaxID=437900 RepID=A0A653E1X6_9PSED|nr:Ribonuclease Z [Pseudomonas marincola]
MARHLLSLGHNNNNKQQKNNKNKTYRLHNNKNNKPEAQLTDSFGEDMFLGLTPQPD